VLADLAAYYGVASKGNQAKKRLLHFEDCAHAIDQLFRKAMETEGNKAFNDFLGFAHRFNNLSVYNAMLVQLQRPGAVAVGTRSQWRNIGRTVSPDAIPIVILWPFGPVQFLFELADTAGDPLPGQDQNPLYAHGMVTAKQMERIVKAANSHGIQVEETGHYGDNLAGTAAGLYVGPEFVCNDSQWRFRVKLNAKHGLPSKFATLAHELGHIYCGHLGTDGKGRWPNRSRLSKSVRELEAEAVAWLVCQRNNITSRSQEYLNQLVDQAGLQAVSMYATGLRQSQLKVRSHNQSK